MKTFGEVLGHSAHATPDRPAFIVLDRGEAETAWCTARALFVRARAIAARLDAAGARGTPVLLGVPPGLDYVASLFGCFLAGAIATPMYPPRSSRHTGRLRGILHDTGARLALVSAAPTQVWPEAVHLIDPTSIPDEDGTHWTAPAIAGHAPALLQYTSGSTADPKGVLLSHEALLANQRALQWGFGQTSESTIVSWLPPYHDMGLIGTILHPVFVGATCVLMPPGAFLQRPVRWLRAITEHYATTSGGPNFAYEHCCRTIAPDECEGLDLRRWTIAFNGAERVQRGTLRRFAEQFAPWGFRADAWRPCYGLAEATLVVSVCRDNAEATSGEDLVEPARAAARHDLVSCGLPVPEHQLAIVDPDTRIERVDSEPGEIWWSGPSVAMAYWNRPALTESELHARLDTHPERTFLRTGDLGFVRDGQLVVVGRRKDLIIIRGENHYPDDIERTLLAAGPRFAEGRCAAVAMLAAGDEQLAIVQETIPRDRADADQLAGVACARIAERHGVVPRMVMFVRPGTLPRTPSGKIQRGLCQEWLTRGDLRILFTHVVSDATTTPRTTIGAADDGSGTTDEIETALERYLTNLLTSHTGRSVDDVRATPDLGALGIDSLGSATLARHVETDWQVVISPALFLEGLSLTAAVTRIAAEYRAPRPARVPGDTLDPEGPRALSAAQERLLQIARLGPNNPALVLHGALDLRGALDVASLRRAVATVLARHDSLRTSIVDVEGRPMQAVMPASRASSTAGPAAIPVIDLRTCGSPWTAAAALLSAAPFDVQQAPLYRVALLWRGRRRARLALAISHVIADAWSVDVFFRDVLACYRRFVEGRGALLPPLDRHPVEIAALEAARLREPDGVAHVDWWRARLAGVRPAPLPPPSRSGGQSDHGTRHRTVRLSERRARALEASCAACGVTPFAALLTVLHTLMAHHTGQTDLTVTAPVAGRHRAGFEDVIACLANRVAVRTRIAPTLSLWEAVQETRVSVLETLAHQDVPLGAVERAALESGQIQLPAVLSQFLFQYYAAAKPVTLPRLYAHSHVCMPSATAFDLFTIARRRRKGLRVDLRFKAEAFNAATADAIAKGFALVVDALIDTPETRIADLRIPMDDIGGWPHDDTLGLGIAATFTADLVADSLRFWMMQLRMPATFAFAPFDQVMQQLLDPASLLARNIRGINIVLLRLIDWLDHGESRRPDLDALERTSGDFVRAVETYLASSATPLIVCLGQSPARGDELRACEQRLAARLEALPGVHAITPDQIAVRYPVGEPFAALADQLARVPYTREYFAVLGTMLARKILRLRRAAPKVLALDADGTLWHGTCGEDGPHGVVLDAAAVAAQEFVQRLIGQGTLICLCSKNNEADVTRVFDERAGLHVRWTDFVATRVDWRPKPENVRSLAEQLGLSLDTFAFLDDDPHECAEMRARCPEVTTIQLPAARDEVPAFLQHLWLFDELRTTDEDRARTQYYRDDATRRGARERAATLEEFLAGLRIEIRVVSANERDLPRIAQLVQRTNQFTLGGPRLSEVDVHRVWRSVNRRCLCVSVRDRFGDYGLVGAVLYEARETGLRVDTLVLSCRVLGRGVERALLDRLLETAAGCGVAAVEFVFRDTGRNRPAWDFFSVACADAVRVTDDVTLFRHSLPPAVAAAKAATASAIGSTPHARA